MEALDILVQTVQTMHSEQRVDHQLVIQKLDSLNNTMTVHTAEDSTRFAALDKRLAPIESLRTTMRWTVGTLFAAIAYGAFDFVVNHLPRLLGGK